MSTNTVTLPRDKLRAALGLACSTLRMVSEGKPQHPSHVAEALRQADAMFKLVTDQVPDTTGDRNV